MVVVIKYIRLAILIVCFLSSIPLIGNISSFRFQFAWLSLIQSILTLLGVIMVMIVTFPALHSDTLGIAGSVIIIIVAGIVCILSVSIRRISIGVVLDSDCCLRISIGEITSFTTIFSKRLNILCFYSRKTFNNSLFFQKYLSHHLRLNHFIERYHEECRHVLLWIYVCFSEDRLTKNKREQTIMSHLRQFRRDHIDDVRHLFNQILPNDLRNHSIL